MDGFLLLLIVAAAMALGALLKLPFSISTAIPVPTFDLSDEHIARIAHEANRAYCITRGDMSKRAWQNTEPSVREGTIAGVARLRANPNLTPEELHASWCEDRINRGYRYGPTVCHRERTHPCLVPYDQLDEEQRFKDYLFRAIVLLTAVR